MLFVILSFLFIANSEATEQVKSYQEEDAHKAYTRATFDGVVSQAEANHIILIASNPHAPTNSHVGKKFLEALSWYNDITVGNKNGRLSIHELNNAFEGQLRKYLGALSSRASRSRRMSDWKMLQKLKILEKIIKASGRSYYPYRSKELSKISYKNEWNKKNTILSSKDFYNRVIKASWHKPVLVKFGLTYCVHCLLMENLGSVPAVARKYSGDMMVYKLWWNPNEPQRFFELNAIASEEGVGSSPIFNLYIDGRLVKSEYAFPDEDGSGMEEFLEGYL